MSKKRNRFDLSYPVQSTFDAGYLIPFYVQDTLPNDTFYISNKSFIRAQPMTAPLLHQVDAYVQYFYCPERILWENTEEFFLGMKVLEGQAGPTRPYVVAPSDGFSVGSLADYLGFPTGQGGIKVSAIPFRAYARIWNEKYRAKDKQAEVPVFYEDGLDTTTSQSLLSPRWHRDYFQKAEIERQLGTAVDVPIIQTSESEEAQYYHVEIQVGIIRLNSSLSRSAFSQKYDGNNFTNSQCHVNRDNFASSVLSAVKSIASPLSLEPGVEYLITSDGSVLPFSEVTSYSAVSPYMAYASDGSSTILVAIKVVSKELEKGTNEIAGFIPTSSFTILENSCAAVLAGFYLKVSSNIVYHSSSLMTSGFLSINNLSQATHLQRYKERMLKADGDYSKFIKSNFGFELRSDIIDEPQYLGGSKLNIVFSEVLQTSEGTDGGVGSMYGHGVGRGKQRPIKFRCPEHGIIIGLLSVRPRFVYHQGIERAWTRESIFDFFLPDFTDIGPQEVMQKELYATSNNDSILFGYSDRYSEYRSRVPKICGEFKTTLSDWNMAMKFAAPPVLNGSFLSMESGIEGFKRPFAVRDEHSYLMYMYNRVTAIRAVPRFSGRTKI